MERTDATQLVARVSGFQDVDAQVRAERALAASERRYRMAMEFAPMGMAVVDLDRRFVEVNSALCRMTGRDREWLLEHRTIDILDEKDHESWICICARRSAPARRTPPRTTNAWSRRRGPGSGWEHSVGLLRDDDGAPTSYVSQFVDVDEAHRQREQLRHRAGHDSLTSLPNRHELMERVGQMLVTQPRDGARLAILFLDLDRFKSINDTHGHAVGDQVLVEVARRLRSQVRANDVVARLGGDEFIVALPAVKSVDDAHKIAAKIHESFTEELPIRDASLTVSVSIGLTLAEAGEDPDTVLERADRALYRAKGAGRNQTAHQSAEDET